MKRFVRNVMTAAVVLFAALVLAMPAWAAKVYLKDGRVLEGTITKEGDGFLFLKVSVGGVDRQEIITSDQIKSIERDAEKVKGGEKEADGKAAEAKETPAAGSPVKSASPVTVIPPGATKVCFITLEETVGPYLNAEALIHSANLLDKLPEGERPDIIVLDVNSGGGALSEVQPLSNAIHEKLKRDKKYRVVAWIRSAISAASLTAANCEEIYFRSQGNFGGTVAYSMNGGGAKAMDGEGLEYVLQMGEMISKRGGYNPLIMRAMQMLMPLSCDIDEDGLVTWYEGTGGKILVNPPDRILTFNSDLALSCKFSKGTANTKDQLARAMGCKEWVEVGPQADLYQVAFREAVKEAEARTNELRSKMGIAIQFGQAPRAKTFLEELRSIARWAPSMAQYGGLTKEYFEETEKQIRKIIDEQEKMKKDQRQR